MIPRKKQFEQVAVDEWLTGEITDIEYEQDHEFTFKGEKKTADAVKITLKLDGYDQKKSTGWQSFSYAVKSNLYKLFVEPLVEGAFPNMPFDLDQLKGLKVKVMYSQKGEYQSLTMVRPAKGKIISSVKQSSNLAEVIENEPDESPLPF